MANPFDFKDIAATIQRFSKESNAFYDAAPAAGSRGAHVRPRPSGEDRGPGP